MWVKTQFNEVRKIDNMYTHNGYAISTYDGESLIELGRYKTEEETNEVINSFWNCIVNGGKTFQMPKEIVKRI